MNADVIDLTSRKIVRDEMNVPLDPRRGRLTDTQRAFATSRQPFPAIVGGYGSGKSAAGIARAMALKSMFREQNIAYYLPTYPLVEDIAFERFPELCERKGWRYRLRKTGGAPHIEFPGSGSGKILFRTMEKPERIVGYEVAHSILDELDTLDMKKAEKVWNKVIARNRQKLPNGFPNTVGVVTTPEGFRFVYKRWVKEHKKGYVLWHASTYENSANLPAGYIENLENTYPPNLLQAYLLGQFVNLTSGSVYTAFDRIRCFTNAVPEKGEPLHVGMDFNVGKMAAIVHVIRGQKPYAVGELVNLYDTPDMIQNLLNRYPGHQITVYPDSSGKNRNTTGAGVSDIALLQQAKFMTLYRDSNPLVKDRVNAMNAAFYRGDYKVNPDTCPVYTEALEKQVYNEFGTPDKTLGFDHPTDAGGYFIHFKYPVMKPALGITLGLATNG